MLALSYRNIDRLDPGLYNEKNAIPRSLRDGYDQNPKNNVRMVAHRGVSGLERGNTYPAFPDSSGQDPVAAQQGSDPEDIQTLIDHELDLDLRYAMVTQKLIDTLHALGKEINCWP